MHKLAFGVLKPSIFFLVTAFVSVSFAHAGEIAVYDSFGDLRAAAEVGESGVIRMKVSLKDGQILRADQVKIKNRESGFIIIGWSSGDTVVFEGVPAGIWDLIADGEVLVLADVGIEGVALAGGESSELSLAGRALVGGAIAAGGVGAVLGINSTSDNGKPLSPSS